MVSKRYSVEGRAIVETENTFYVKSRYSNEVLTKVRKKHVSTAEEALAFWLEEEDNRYIRKQQSMWDYV
ncbi:MAG: hypothetical protein ACRC6B_12720 [Fusobacteriaceae bacterium]